MDFLSRQINKYCLNEVASGHGAVIECLRTAMGEGKLTNNKMCMMVCT